MPPSTGPTLSARLSEFFQDSPLRHKPFRMFYFGTIAAALGTEADSPAPIGGSC